jgi:hypothetical protein
MDRAQSVVNSQTISPAGAPWLCGSMPENSYRQCGLTPLRSRQSIASNRLLSSISVAKKKSLPARKPRKAKLSTKKDIPGGECVIPPQVKDEALNLFKFDPGNEREADRISGYVEWQCAKDGERVTYLEKIRTENVFGTDYDCWNVRTDKERYWVITNPTNLYSQELFPSLDYTLSFHIGVMARVQAQRKGASTERVGDRLATAFRRWEQAAEALDASKESEEVQAVGMRCRECLIAFVRSLADPKMVPEGQDASKALGARSAAPKALTFEVGFRGTVT